MKFYSHIEGVLIEEIPERVDGCVVCPDDFIKPSDLANGYYTYDGNNVSLNSTGLVKRNLDRSDWKVTRHRDEVALEIETTLTDVEYKELLTKRQAWRNITGESNG